jgi:hypothetical protein
MYRTLRECLRWIVIGICSAAMTCAVAADAPRRVALLVGNWDYNGNGVFDANPMPPYVTDLKNPCHDVALIKQKLEQARFEVHDYCNLSFEQFNSAAASFHTIVTDMPKRSMVFYYFSGHGLQTHGRVFTVPVRFKFNADAVGRLTPEAQYEYFRGNANEVSSLLNIFPDDFDVAVVVALDNCRDSPISESDAYNDSVSIRTPPNALVQYSTTATDVTPDGAGANSDYAVALAEQLAKGGDVGHIISRVGSQFWKRYRAGNRETYAETDVGEAFKALYPIPLSLTSAAPPPPRPPTPPPVGPPQATPPKKQIIRSTYDGVSVDVLWCQGPDDGQRYAYALDLARQIASRAKEFHVGRVQLKPLTQAVNVGHGYNVFRNLMRYDFDGGVERTVLLDIAAAFPDGNFLPQRGIGAHGHTFHNYGSIFVCDHGA